MIIASAVISTGRKPREAGLDRGLHRVAMLGEPLAREGDDQDAVRGGDAHAHDGAHQRRHAQRRVR